jgi:hypothetical protein
MRLGLMALGVLPGCFVITPGDVEAHDALSGDWEGEWSQEEGEESGGMEISFGRSDWQGSVELLGEWSESELQGLRKGDELVMVLFGDEPFEFEMELEATLSLIDRIDGDCVLVVESAVDVPCTFSLRPL